MVILVKCEEIVFGKKLFDRMPITCVVWPSKNYGPVKALYLKEALNVFIDRKRSGMRSNQVGRTPGVEAVECGKRL